MDFADLGAKELSLAGTSPSHWIARSLSQGCLIFLLVASVLAPVVTVSDSLPWFRVEQLALLPIGLGYLWLLLAGYVRPPRFNWLFVIAPAYCFCILLSTFYGSFVLGHEFLVRDLFEVPKALLPTLFFIFGLGAAPSEKWIRRLLGWLAASAGLVCTYAFAQWLNLGIANQLNQIYSGGFHDDGSLAHYRRVYSTMGNPNLLAQLMTWIIPIFAVAMLFRVGNQVRNCLVVLICLAALAMTGSRYGLLDTALALALIFLLTAPFPRRRKTLITFLLALVPLFAGVIYLVANSNQATLDRFLTLSDPSQTDSFRQRADDIWPEARAQFFQSPVLGHGPAKVIFSDVVTDSEYLDVLKEFGVVGFAAYLAYLCYPLWLLWGGLKCAIRSRVMVEQLRGSYLLLQVAFIMLVTAFVMNIGMSTFYGEPIQGYLWLWLGLGAGMAERFQSGAAVLHAPATERVEALIHAAD
jgi:O-antigen ligase